MWMQPEDSWAWGRLTAHWGCLSETAPSHRCLPPWPPHMGFSQPGGHRGESQSSRQLASERLQVEPPRTWKGLWKCQGHIHRILLVKELMIHKGVEKRTPSCDQKWQAHIYKNMQNGNVLVVNLENTIGQCLLLSSLTLSLFLRIPV